MLIHYYRIVSMLIILLFLVSCEKSEIQGEVKDPFGNGIGGVSIQIEKSTFKSVTDSQGKYSVDYVPGAFRVNISKLGFTTHHIDLNLQEKSAFPAETIVMYPIPQEPGIYYLGQQNLVKLTGGIIQATKAEGNWTSYRWTYSSPFYGSLTVPEGVASFIDTVPKPLALSTMNNLVLYEGLVSMIEKKDFQNGFSIMQTAKPKAEKIGNEELTLWTFELKKGQYAFTEYHFLNGLPAPNKEIPIEGGTFIPFRFLQMLPYQIRLLKVRLFRLIKPRKMSKVRMSQTATNATVVKHRKKNLGLRQLKTEWNQMWLHWVLPM